MDSSARRQFFVTLLKTLVGVGLLAASLWGMDWGRFGRSFERLSLAWLGGLALLVLFSLLLKVLRSFMFLRNFQVPLGFSRVLEAFFLGQAVSTLLPSRGGDLLRLGYLSADEPQRFPQVTAAVMVEKFLDLIAMAVIALGVSAYLPVEQAARVRAWLLPISGAGVIALALLVLGGPRGWDTLRGWLAGRGPAWLPRLLRIGDQLIASSVWLRQPAHLLPALSLTAVIWTSMWLTNLTLFHALALELPLAAGGLVLILVYIGVLPALMPGNIGPFYFFAQMGVAVFGAVPEDAAVFAVILHAVVTLVPLLVGGIVFLFSDQVRSILLLQWQKRRSTSA